MYIVSINILSIIVAAITMQGLGFLWYSSVLFGKQWMQLIGMPTEMPNETKKEIWKGYLLNGIGSLISSYVLALVIANLVVTNIFQGIQVSFYVWLGFIAPVLLAMHIFSYPPKSWALYIINAGYFLTSFVAGGIIITIFSL
jgi:hypothetical protein